MTWLSFCTKVNQRQHWSKRHCKAILESQKNTKDTKAIKTKISDMSFCSFFQIFFYCYLAVPLPTLGHSQGNSLTNPMLITAFVQVRTEGHQKPRNEVGSLNLAECLAGFEPGTFRFWLQHLNPLGHSPQDTLKSVMNSKGYQLKKELKSSLQ